MTELPYHFKASTMNKQQKTKQPVKPIGQNCAPWTWQNFAWLADEWFTLYAYSHKKLMSVTMFALAHTVELYLKAGVAKRSGCIEDAVAFGHNLLGIWQDLKTKDNTFMPGYEIRSKIFNLAYEMDEEGIQKTLTESDWNHYLIHRELYLVIKFVADLKYFGAPLKKPMINYLSYVQRNPYWVEFLRCFRDWLWKGETVRNDRASFLAAFGEIDEVVVQYLKGLGLHIYGPPVTLFRYSAIDGHSDNRNT